MVIEIERRFLLEGEEWKVFSKNVQEFQQGYLSTNFEEWVVRIRIINNKSSAICIKALAEGMKNHEFEYPIPLKDALLIWNRITKKFFKKRYSLDLGGGEWIVDCFQGENYPLIIGEVELESEKDLINTPSWCKREITGIKQFSNAALAEVPISHWSQTEKERFNLL